MLINANVDLKLQNINALVNASNTNSFLLDQFDCKFKTFGIDTLTKKQKKDHEANDSVH